MVREDQHDTCRTGSGIPPVLLESFEPCSLDTERNPVAVGWVQEDRVCIELLYCDCRKRMSVENSTKVADGILYCKSLEKLRNAESAI